MRKLPFLLAVTLILSACGEVSQAAEDSVKKEVATALTKQCTDYVTQSNVATMVPPEKAEAVCGCTSTELVATQKLTELADMNMEKAMPIFQKCAGEAGLDLNALSDAAQQQGE